jgi:hypothetical protein
MHQAGSGLASKLACKVIFCAAIAGIIAAIPVASSVAQHSTDHGSSGGGGGGHSAGGHDSDSHAGGSHGGRKGKSGKGLPHGGAGRGRHGTGIEDKVLRSGQASAPRGDGTSRSRPVWAGGGIPEDVELGRLNVARAPEKVLKKALDEAYITNLDKNVDNILDADADLTAIDSPRANLALYREALSGARKVQGAWTQDQAAIFLGKAADKNIAISMDTVSALNLILEVSPDVSTFSYDRAGAYPSELSTVFGGKGYTGTGIGAFAQAADDARAITLYQHDNR